MFLMKLENNFNQQPKLKKYFAYKNLILGTFLFFLIGISETVF